jgi:hypothetical protein
MSNHSFDIHIAAEYKSVDIAILVWHFHYWIMKNKRMNKNCIEGRTWTYQTNLEIAAAFPYWSIYQVERLVKKAVELKILRKANYNKTQFERTVWYAFEDEEKFGISRFREMESAEPRNGNREIANCNKDIDTLPDALKDKDMSEPPFGRVALYFYEKLQKINPKVKKPNLDKWAKELTLLSKDGNSEEDIVKAIDYVISTHGQASANGFCWANVILSPTSLRNNFAKLWAQMGCGTPILRANPDENKKFADKLQKQFQNRADINFGYNYVEFINGMRSNKYEFLAKDFQEKCLHELRTRKLIKDSA